MNDENTFDGFTGVFNFTNWTDEDFVHLWNNKEYIFPANSTSPLLINEESAENIQEIRKRFAYDLAQREYYKGKEYKNLVKIGKDRPSTFNPKILEPMIQKCLMPLPVKKAKVRILPKDDERKYKGSKAVGKNDNLNYVFKEESEEQNIKKVGAMPTNEI
jgi:hypothetical protein